MSEASNDKNQIGGSGLIILQVTEELNIRLISLKTADINLNLFTVIRLA